MPKKAELLACRYNEQPGKEFLFAYQRSVLLALEKEGFLNPEQLEACLGKLERRSM